MATLKELAANPGTAKLEFDISVSMPARTIPGQWLKDIDMYSFARDLGAAGTWNEAQASEWIYGIVNRLLSQNAGVSRVLPTSVFITAEKNGSISANQWTFDTRCTFNQRGKINFAGDLSQASVSDVQLTAHIGAGKEALDYVPGSPLWEIKSNTQKVWGDISCTISNVMVNGANAEDLLQPGEEEDNPNAPLIIRGRLIYSNWIQTDINVPGLAQMKDDSPEWAKAFVYEPLSRAMGMEINEENCAFGPVNMPGRGEWQVNYPVSQWQSDPTGAETLSCMGAGVLIALFNLPSDSLPVNLKVQKAGDSWVFEKGLRLDITYKGRSL